MPIDPDNIDALPDYTAAQRLKMVRAAIMNLLTTGQSYTISEAGGGRTKVSASLDQLRAMEKELEQEVASSSETDTDAGGLAVGRFGEPQ